MQVQRPVADRHQQPAGTLARKPPHTERQILNRKICLVSLGGLHPAMQPGIAGIHSHPRALRSSTGSTNEHDPKLIQNCSRASAICCAVNVTPLLCHVIVISSIVMASASRSLSIHAASCRRSCSCHSSTAAQNRFRKPCITACGLSCL